MNYLVGMTVLPKEQYSGGKVVPHSDFRVRTVSRINLPLFSTFFPAIIYMFLSCRPFVSITTLSTGFVGVEVTSVSWLGQLTVGV